MSSLESQSCHAEVRLYAFDLRMDDSVDVRNETVALLTSSTTTTRPASIGPRLFEPACKMGPEEIVSKHGEHGYKAGPCKIGHQGENPKSAVMVRASRMALADLLKVHFCVPAETGQATAHSIRC
jgi:hypothetical protein